MSKTFKTIFLFIRDEIISDIHFIRDLIKGKRKLDFNRLKISREQWIESFKQDFDWYIAILLCVALTWMFASVYWQHQAQIMVDDWIANQTKDQLYQINIDKVFQ